MKEGLKAVLTMDDWGDVERLEKVMHLVHDALDGVGVSDWFSEDDGVTLTITVESHLLDSRMKVK